jgi:hypothetical protein
MDRNKCNICNQTFDSEQELQEHRRMAHQMGRREQDRPGGDQDPEEEEIAS